MKLTVFILFTPEGVQPVNKIIYTHLPNERALYKLNGVGINKLFYKRWEIHLFLN